VFARTLRVLLPALIAVCAVALHGVPVDATGGVATVTSPNGLNLRSAPNTQATVIAVIPYSSVLTLIGDPTADGWYPVTFGSLSGWAYGDYLTPGLVSPIVAQNAAPLASGPAAPPPGPPAAPAASPAGPPAIPAVATPGPASSPAVAGTTPVAGSTPVPTSPVTMFTTDVLNLRATPDPNGVIEMAMPPGAAVQVMGPAAASTWDPILYNGTSGWADAAYLAPVSGASAAATNAAASTSTSVVSTAPLSAAQFGNPTLGTPAGPESGLPVGAPPAGTLGKFIWPVTQHRISTLFQPVHQAIDIDQFPSGGNPVRAIADGIVTFAGGDPCCSYGLYVIIQHAGGFSSLYAHLSREDVTQGQLVHQGQQLGLSGNTGNSTGAHVHFAIYYNGNPIDPLSVLPPDAQIESGANCYRAC
jgi:murein DD-endopeptidase MepM/ murein hydrolase activator NlpD